MRMPKRIRLSSTISYHLALVNSGTREYDRLTWIGRSSNSQAQPTAGNGDSRGPFLDHVVTRVHKHISNSRESYNAKKSR